MNSNSVTHSSNIMPLLCHWTYEAFDYRRLHHTAHSYHKPDADTQTQLQQDSTNNKWPFKTIANGFVKGPQQHKGMDEQLSRYQTITSECSYTYSKAETQHLKPQYCHMPMWWWQFGNHCLMMLKDFDCTWGETIIMG